MIFTKHTKEVRPPHPALCATFPSRGRLFRFLLEEKLSAALTDEVVLSIYDFGIFQ